MARSVSAVRTCDGLFFGRLPPFVRVPPLRLLENYRPKKPF
jgi:hypothetical protein